MPSIALATEGISLATRPKWLRMARPVFSLRAGQYFCSRACVPFVALAKEGGEDESVAQGGHVVAVLQRGHTFIHCGSNTPKPVAPGEAARPRSTWVTM